MWRESPNNLMRGQVYECLREHKVVWSRKCSALLWARHLRVGAENFGPQKISIFGVGVGFEAGACVSFEHWKPVWHLSPNILWKFILSYYCELGKGVMI